MKGKHVSFVHARIDLRWMVFFSEMYS